MINKKVSYLKGLAEGYGLKGEKNNVEKIILEMLDCLEDIADEIDFINSDFERLEDYVEMVDDDLAELESYFDDDDCCCCDDDDCCCCCDDEWDDFDWDEDDEFEEIDIDED